MRIGILGYGAIAEEHARALARAGCSLGAVAGPKLSAATAFAKAHRVAHATGDVAAVIGAHDIDAIVIASPSDVHAEQALSSLQHGKHVLCEVPLALSLADADRVSALSLTTDRRIMVCQTERFLRPMQLLRTMVQQETIRHIVVRLVLNRTTNVGVTGRARSWTDNLVWHHGSHAVDTALWLLDDDVVDVAAFGAGDGGNGSPLNVGGLIRTASGAVVTLALSYTAQQPSTDFMVMSDADTYRFEHGVLSSSTYGRQKFDEAALFVEAVEQQDAAFVNAVTAGVDPAPAPADLSAVYRTLELLSRDVAVRPR